jgi:hypothetical protein
MHDPRHVIRRIQALAVTSTYTIIGADRTPISILPGIAALRQIREALKVRCTRGSL